MIASARTLRLTWIPLTASVLDWGAHGVFRSRAPATTAWKELRGIIPQVARGV